MATFTTKVQWHQNTSNAGKVQVLAEEVSLTEAENALLSFVDSHVNSAIVSFEDGNIIDSEYSPSEIWVRGDGSLRYGDYTIIIEEA